MSKLPICTCQSGLREFAWQPVCFGGPQLGGYEVHRCPDCSRSAYHLPSYKLFFIPKKLIPDEEILLWLRRMEHVFQTIRSEAGVNLASVSIGEIPQNVSLYTQRENAWELVEDSLKIEVPLKLSLARLTVDFALFFLSPPQLCRSAYD